MVGLAVYGSGTVALPIVLAHRGQLTELLTFEGMVFWGWGFFASLFCTYLIVTVYRARLYIRRRGHGTHLR